MNLAIFSGSANVALAESIAQSLGVGLGRRTLGRFPDSELNVELQESVRGHAVYLVQPTGPPVDEHLLELLFLADACRRAGASQLVALIPYLGYSRQDRRATGRGAIGARVVSDLIAAGGIERVVAVDLHVTSLEGFFSVPLEALSAVAILAEALRPLVPANAVIVAPDLGAVKMAERYARLLGLPIAFVYKTRISGEAVEARGIVGDIRGRMPVIVDDIISTGGTIEVAFKVAQAAGAAPEAIVAATHALLVGPAVARRRARPIKRLVVTDSVAVPGNLPLPIQVTGLGALLAEAVRRLHSNQSLSDLIAHS